MGDYKRGSHSVWDCKHHLVWTTKYRYLILGGEVGQRCRELLIGIPPQLSVSRAVQFLKGKSSHKLLSEYASLRKRYWGQRLWARGYWVATSGNVTDEVWQEYIKNQKPPDPDDDFQVV